MDHSSPSITDTNHLLMIMDITVLIMAGGSGERFWPLSTKERPKQLLKLVDQERSLIRMTVDRILPLVSAERVFIATNAIQAEGVLEELPVIDPKNIIIEPAFRDTAAAVGFGCVVIGERFPGSTMIVLASDHLIKDEGGFREALSTAVGIADSRIVTLGIKPTHPETGYGYLECGELIKGQPSRVLRFCEKPALEVAESYLESGRFLWNSGMFIFRIETMMNAFKKHLPGHSNTLEKISQLRKQSSISPEFYTQSLRELFEEFVKISLDFGIMERFEETWVIPVDIGWNDIGSFPALAEVFEANQNGTISRGAELREYNSFNNIVISEKRVALLGVKDLVVVETDDALLICSKEEAQNIKKIL